VVDAVAPVALPPPNVHEYVRGSLFGSLDAATRLNCVRPETPNVGVIETEGVVGLAFAGVDGAEGDDDDAPPPPHAAVATATSSRIAIP
jgi:hypothetical protein